jgi:hypothetical protein
VGNATRLAARLELVVGLAELRAAEGLRDGVAEEEQLAARAPRHARLARLPAQRKPEREIATGARREREAQDGTLRKRTSKQQATKQR